ncbi:hypothetical protein TNCV_5107751 [Trichonephila clavipes]|nr:hypothetical protein TNCV_5107751 [Trichonephila clavipes]
MYRTLQLSAPGVRPVAMAMGTVFTQKAASLCKPSLKSCKVSKSRTPTHLALNSSLGRRSAKTKSINDGRGTPAFGLFLC